MSVERALGLIDSILETLKSLPDPKGQRSVLEAGKEKRKDKEEMSVKREEETKTEEVDTGNLTAKQLKKLKKQEKKKAKDEKLEKQVAASANKPKEKKKKIEKATKELPSYHLHDPKTAKKKSLAEVMAMAYNPAEVEKDWDKYWEHQGFYQPEMKTDKENFVMVIPPPNVTGSLHLGHALMATIEDAITRYWRMKGKNTLWLPGTDHAGIATQAVVERRLQREGISKHKIGREKFLDEVWKWKKDYGGKICGQLRRMGCSVDWSREVFTMDDKLSQAVTEAFVRMYEKGLVYRANRLCHWSCQLQSAISNAEVELVQLTEPTMMNIPGYSEPVEFGVLHRFKYQLDTSASGGPAQFVEVATTRIETMLGDTAVAVHPDDERYSQLHGRFAIHPFLKRKLPIVCDSFVDPNFGSGAVKITPAHDENDFECGRRHNLDFINVLTEDGRINANGGDLFVGMPRYEARAAVIAELTKRGLFVGQQSNPMSLQLCSRSKDVIEPYLKPQWYVNCIDMAKKALDVVFVTKELKIMPGAEGERLWQYFLGNIRPWCISRQLWWGHRIPAWQVHFEKTATTTTTTTTTTATGNAESAKLSEMDMSHWIIARTEAEALEKACARFGKKKSEITLVQDPDVLDTWFSSGLFPFSTMGWPDESSVDLQKFFPGTLLETGSDIIFFWVARMVMMSLELTGQLPFKEVLLHPIVRDKDGSKMSKSKGNVIDPLHIINGVELKVLIDELHSGNIKDSDIPIYEAKKQEDFPNGIPPCGTDALRFGLLSYLSQHRNINLDVARIVGYRQFCNKIWNAVRFAISKFDQHFVPPNAADFVKSKDFKDHATFADRWILSRLNHAITLCHTHNPVYEFYQSTDAVFQFFTRELCDVYLELIKGIFRDANATKQQRIAANILYLCVDLSLKLMHPFMPFVSEELWQRLPGPRSTRDALIVQAYPTPFSDWTNSTIEKEMNLVLNVIKNLRSHKQTNLNLPTKTVYDVAICTTIPFILETVGQHKHVIQTLALIGDISITNTETHSDPTYSAWSLAEHQIIIDEQTLKYVSYHNVSGLEKKKEN